MHLRGTSRRSRGAKPIFPFPRRAPSREPPSRGARYAARPPEARDPWSGRLPGTPRRSREAKPTLPLRGRSAKPVDPSEARTMPRDPSRCGWPAVRTRARYIAAQPRYQADFSLRGMDGHPPGWAARRSDACRYVVAQRRCEAPSPPGQAGLPFSSVHGYAVAHPGGQAGKPLRRRAGPLFGRLWGACDTAEVPSQNGQPSGRARQSQENSLGIDYAVRMLVTVRRGEYRPRSRNFPPGEGCQALYLPGGNAPGRHLRGKVRRSDPVLCVVVELACQAGIPL